MPELYDFIPEKDKLYNIYCHGRCLLNARFITKFPARRKLSFENKTLDRWEKILEISGAWPCGLDELFKASADDRYIFKKGDRYLAVYSKAIITEFYVNYTTCNCGDDRVHIPEYKNYAKGNSLCGKEIINDTEFTGLVTCEECIEIFQEYNQNYRDKQKKNKKKI
jgi:hypothetical protein